MKSEMLLKAGFGRADITAQDPISMGGYGDPLQRLSEGVLSRLYTTCIAITDGNDQTLLLYTIDHLCTNHHWMPDLRSAITAATGVPGDKILLSATHTHSGPDVRDTIGVDHGYYALFKNALVEAAKDAMADRAAARVYTGHTQAEDLNFVRHYVMSDGFMAGDNFGDTKNAHAVRHHHKADGHIGIIRFQREGHKDILMINFQAHAKLASTAASKYGREHRRHQSADVIGATRDYVEQQLGVLCACFQGAAGNLNPCEPYMQVMHNKEARRTIEAYGAALGSIVADAQSALKEMAVPALLKTKQVTFHTLHKSTEQELAMELDAVSLGDIGLVTAPYEMFDTSGKQIREGSPFPMTFVLTYANGRFGYIADDPTWDYVSADGRKAWELVLSYVKRGTAEELVSTYVSMLKELK